MRKRITIMALLIWLFTTRQTKIFAQNHCSDDINTTSTRWDASGSPNTWNWTNTVRTNNPVYLHNNLDAPSTYIDLPWFCNSCPSMGSTPQTHSANAGNYLFRTTQDIYPDDGWELLTKSFGTQNSTLGSNDGVGVNNPYFILYNRINGKIKVYVALFGPRSAQVGMIRLGFSVSVPGQQRTNNSQAQRALFNHNEPIAKMVMEFNPLGEFKQMNQILSLTGNLDYQWMVGEFITSYDPCTCENLATNPNAISLLNMQVVLTSDVQIDAQIDGSITGSTVASGTSAPSQPGGFLAFAEAAGKSYQNSFDKWESSSKKLTKGIDFINGVMAQHLQRQFYYSELLNNDTFLSANESRKLVKDLMKWPDSVKTVFGVPKRGDSKEEKILNAIKGVASKVPYVGAAIGVLDFLSSGGDELPSPSQVGPVTFNVNLQLTGSLIEYATPVTTDFYTPGSPVQTQSQYQPIYNNVLGVFNVLELPDMEYAEINPRNITNTSYEVLKAYSNNFFEEDNDCELGYREFHGLDGAGDVKFRQYRPTSNLKYVLNPASNLEVESIEAAFVLEYQKDQNLYLERPDHYNTSAAFPFYDLASTPQENDKLYRWGLQSGTGFSIGSQIIKYDLTGKQVSMIKVFDTSRSKTATFHRYESIRNTSNLDLEFVSAKYPLNDTSYIRFRTNYVPITCFQEANFILLGTNNLPKLYCKLYVRLKRKDKTNSDPVTIVITYDMSTKLKNAVINSSFSGQYDCAVRGNSYRRKLNCCFKCGTKLDFRSAEIWDYNYFGDFKLVSVPFSPTLYTPLHAVYKGEQDLAVRGTLEIPDNSFVPSNSTLKAAGKITIGFNVSFGSNVKIITGTKIVSKGSPLLITPGVKLLTVPVTDIWFNCSNGDYEGLHMTQSEIAQFCNSKELYLEKVYLSSIKEDKLDSNYNIKNTNGPRVVPNPTSGILRIVWEQQPKNEFTVRVTDVSGRTVYSLSQHGHISDFLEVDLSSNPDGIYFVTLQEHNRIYTQKVLLSK